MAEYRWSDEVAPRRKGVAGDARARADVTRSRRRHYVWLAAPTLYGAGTALSLYWFGGYLVPQLVLALALGLTQTWVLGDRVKPQRIWSASWLLLPLLGVVATSLATLNAGSGDLEGQLRNTLLGCALVGAVVGGLQTALLREHGGASIWALLIGPLSGLLLEPAAVVALIVLLHAPVRDLLLPLASAGLLWGSLSSLLLYVLLGERRL